MPAFTLDLYEEDYSPALKHVSNYRRFRPEITSTISSLCKRLATILPRTQNQDKSRLATRLHQGQPSRRPAPYPGETEGRPLGEIFECANQVSRRIRQIDDPDMLGNSSSRTRSRAAIWLGLFRLSRARMFAVHREQNLIEEKPAYHIHCSRDRLSVTPGLTPLLDLSTSASFHASMHTHRFCINALGICRIQEKAQIDHEPASNEHPMHVGCIQLNEDLSHNLSRTTKRDRRH